MGFGWLLRSQWCLIKTKPIGFALAQRSYNLPHLNPVHFLGRKWLSKDGVEMEIVTRAYALAGLVFNGYFS